MTRAASPALSASPPPQSPKEPGTGKTTGSHPRPVADGSTATTLNKREDSPFQQVGDANSRHGQTLSYSIPSLPELELVECKEIIFLKIPCVLQLLSRLTTVSCGRLQMINCKARNLSFFSYHGGKIKLSLGQQLQMKKLCMYYLDLDVIDEIPSIMPNLETINIGLNTEVVKMPMLSTKFLCLKHITIKIWRTTSPSYD